MEEYESRTVNIFKALGNPIRYQILKNLHKNGELTPTQMGEILNRKPPRVSSHLKILRDSDLVRFRTENHHVFYRLKNEKIISVIKNVQEIVTRK